jgi:hypothetical protein
MLAHRFQSVNKLWPRSETLDLHVACMKVLRALENLQHWSQATRDV